MQVHAWKDMAWEKVTDTISRRFIVGRNEMIAQVYLKKGSVVPEHSHESEQITYILEGALKFWIEGEEMIVRTGEVLPIPPNVPHKAEALEDTLDVDLFSPVRNDWIEKTDTYFHEK